MCDLTTWTGTACPADTSTWYGIGCGPCSGEGFTVTSIALDGCFPDAAGPVVELEPNLGALTTLTRLQFSGSNVGVSVGSMGSSCRLPVIAGTPSPLHIPNPARAARRVSDAC